jgi:oligopeptide transport system ATP-binding protein
MTAILQLSDTEHETEPALVEVHDLAVHFPIRRGWFGWNRGVVRAVDGVSLQLNAGETLGIVGESGSGKSTLARGILGLVPVTRGAVYFDGERIDDLYESLRREYRQQMQMVFQDPFASLNPRMTVAQIIREPLDLFNRHPARERAMHVLRLMELVGLNPRFVNRYPHEFSGGQRQRIGIARALALEPRVLVLDEPVSALDVSIQAQVINLLAELRSQLGLAYLFIAHDLSVVRHLCDRVGVMYLGRIVEMGPSEAIFTNPKHPYTQALLSAIPIPDPVIERQRQRIALTGEIPSPEKFYQGCRFAERCPKSELQCDQLSPALLGTRHQVACHFATPE